jgi:DnaJ-class molecular chaperone
LIRCLWECQKRIKIGLKRREAKTGHDSGKTEQYIQARHRLIEALPDEVCGYCDGSGVRGPDHRLGEGPCLSCEGTGKVRPWITNYPMDIENMKRFAEFCRYSGGFEIW